VKATSLFSTLALTLVSVGIQAQSVELDIERSVKVEFNSEKGYSYNVYGTSDPAKKTGWKLLGGEDGTGENIVFFYRAESDQKIFFRVESEPSQPGEEPKPQEPVQSVVPITGLPPAESSGTYNLVEAIGENEIGGVYRIGVLAGTHGVVIVLPHPGQKEYRQKQIKLSIYRGGTGLGSGKVSLKVRTLSYPFGDEYESTKLVDNSSKQLTGEVVVLPATALESGRKVVVDLFNDTAQTDGAAGGQWVVSTSSDNSVVHEWDGPSVRLKNPDSSWGGWANLEGPTGAGGPAGPKGDQGPVGEIGSTGDQGPQGPIGERGLTGSQGPAGSVGPKGQRGSIEHEWNGTSLRFKNSDDSWSDWVDLRGPVQSVIPITGLPPAESSGTYNLGEAIGENEIGGVYRIGVSAGTDGVVIVLPHPGQKEYRQKQIKLSIYRGGTELGSGKVSLKVRTPAGDAYESRKLVDNTSKQLTGEVVILPATALESGRKVIVDLFNDTANTDGAAGGQWVVTTAAESIDPTLAHRWEGTQLTLQNPDGTWAVGVNLRGPQGDTGSRGTQGVQGITGPTGPRGPQGAPGSISAQGYDISMLFAMARGDWSNQNFDGKDLSGSVIRQLLGKKEVVHDSSFVGANLTRATFYAEVYSNCDFRDAIIEEVDSDADFPVLINCNLQGASITFFDDLSGQIFSWENLDPNTVKFINCIMPDGSTRNDSGASLTNLDLSGIDFSGLDLSGFNFTDSNLQFANMQNLKGIEGVEFRGADLFGVKFSYLNDDGELGYWWETNVVDDVLVSPVGRQLINGEWIWQFPMSKQTVPQNLLIFKWTSVWHQLQGQEKYYFSGDEIDGGYIAIDLDTSYFYYYNNQLPYTVHLSGTVTLEGDKNKPTKFVNNEWFDYTIVQWDTKNQSGTLTYIDELGPYKTFSTFEKLTREEFIKEYWGNGDGQGGGQGGGGQNATLVVRSGSAFAPDRLEIVLDAATGSGLAIGLELKPSDLQLKVGGGDISDDDAIIVVENAPGGGKKLVIKSKTGAPFTAADIVGANAVPVAVSIPTEGGNSVSVNVTLVAPMKAPSLIANIDETGSAKSINITTDGFTEDEADAYLATIEDQFGDLANFEINGKTLNADEVDIITSVVPTGDPSTPFRVEVEIKPKNPDANLGKVDVIAFVPGPLEVEEGEVPPPPLNLPPSLPIMSPVNGG
jgi:uncharacterized protein YjbI with pentapeptide repeats